MGTAVRRRRRKRWPGTKTQAALLTLTRAFGGKRRLHEAMRAVVMRDWEDDLYSFFLAEEARVDA